MMSRAVTDNLLIVIGLTVAALIGLWYWVQTDQGRYRVDQAKLRLPLFGNLIRMYAVTKFARTLGILTGQRHSDPLRASR